MLFKYNLKYYLKSLFIILFFCFLQVNIFSYVPSSSILCYDKVSGVIGPNDRDECKEEGNIIVPDEDQIRAVCEIYGVNYSSVGQLRQIYTENSLYDENGAQITQYAGNGEYYDITNLTQDGECILHQRVEDYENSISLEDVTIIFNQEWEEGSPPGTSSPPEESSDRTETYDSDFVCYDRLGPFGIFSSKSYCESNETCMFNPSGINILKEDKTLVADQPELASCVNKMDIKECSQYRTENNCNNDRAEVGLKCEWIESQDYSLELFNFKSGICIEKNLDEQGDSIKKDLKKQTMNYRGNLIKDHSFEDSIESSHVSNESIAFDLDNYYVLSSSNDFTYNINISNVYYDNINNYKFVFFVKGEDYFSVNVSMDFLDENEVILNKLIEKKSFNDYSFFQNYTKNSVFKSFGLPENLSKISITIKSNETQVFLDNFVFSVFSQELNEFEILPKESSNCDKCFVGGFNLCTNIKSSLLGDCSYMVDGVNDPYAMPETYLASSEERNPFLLEEWKSQSFFNRDLRCEFYKSSEICLDSNNYLNSKFGKYHNYGKVCSWDDTYGCFKDSNNDSLPDRVNQTYFGQKGFDEYLDEDFEFSCDVIPPRSYVYFKGKNLTGDEVVFDDLSNVQNEYGDIYIYFDVRDSLSPRCDDIGLEESDSEVFYFQNGNTQNILELRDLYTPRFNPQKLKNLLENENELSFQFFDNSGNIEPIKSFSGFDVDLEGPQINLTNSLVSLNEDDRGKFHIYDKNYTFNFSVKDRNYLKNCTYAIYGNDGEVKENNIDIFDTDDGYSFFYVNKNYSDMNTNEAEFSLHSHILNTYPRTDNYTLDVYCFDIFGQKGIYLKKDIVFNLNPDLHIVEPSLGFENENNSFFIGKEAELVLQSGNPYINTCKIHLNSNINEDMLITDVLDESIEHPIEGADHFIKKNITNTYLLNSLADGEYKGNVTCYKPYLAYHNISLIKHTSTPKINISNLYKDDNTTYYIDENNLFYSDYSSEDLIINFSFEDKIGKEYNISKFLNITEDNTNPFVKSIFEKDSDMPGYTKGYRNIINNSGEIIIINTLLNHIPEDTNLGGILIKEGFNKGLYNFTFNVTYFDKVDNNDSFIISFLRDPEHYPSINLSGYFLLEEIVTRDDRDNKFNLYTSSVNPEINFSFSSALYKTYNCNLTYTDSSTSEYFIEDFLNESNKNISFDILTNISENINLKNEDNSDDNIILSCRDNIYNLTSTYTLNLLYNKFKLMFQNPDPSWPKYKDNSFLIGKNSSIIIYSSENDIDSCNIYLNNAPATLNSSLIEPPLEIPNIVNYNRNITNSTFLNSLDDGSYVGNVSCSIPYDIFKYVNITKVSSIPELKVLDVYKSDNSTYHIDSNNVFYADYQNGYENEILVNVSASGYDLYNVLEDENFLNNTYVEVFNGTDFTNVNVSIPSIEFINIDDTTNDKGTLKIEQGSNLYQGVLIEEGFYKGLYNYTFNITYFDKVDNNNSIIFSYLKDKDAEPTLSLTGDFVVNSQDIVTSSYNPNFIVNFSSSEYRTFNCNITYDDNSSTGYEYVNQDLIFETSIGTSFSLKDINENISIGDGIEDTLIFECVDNVFGKTIEQIFNIQLDKLHIEVPDTSLTYDGSILIGKNSFLEIYSKDPRLDNCQVTFNGIIKGNFEINSSEFQLGRDTYYKNLTNYDILNSLEEGYYDGLIECYTPYYINETFNISKFTQIPEMDLNEIYRENPESFYIDSNNVFYANYEDGNIIFNLSTPNYSLGKLLDFDNQNNFIYEIFNGVTFTTDEAPSIEFFNINNSKIQLKISSDEDDEYEGNLIQVGDYKGLHNYTFKITYFDKVNNNNSIVLSYLKDKERSPSMKISGEEGNVIQGVNTLFLSTNDPTLYIDFSSPLYKTYNCNVTYYDSRSASDPFFPIDNYKIIKNDNKGIEINIKQDINSGISITQNPEDELVFRCIDNSYNLFKEFFFTIKYDNSMTLFSGLSLSGSKNKYLKYTNGGGLDTVSDKLTFLLEEDKEQNINCYYRTKPKENYEKFYICNEDYKNTSFFIGESKLWNSFPFSTDEEVIFLSEENGVDPLCKPVDKFHSLINKEC